MTKPSDLQAQIRAIQPGDEVVLRYRGATLSGTARLAISDDAVFVGDIQLYSFSGGFTTVHVTEVTEHKKTPLKEEPPVGVWIETNSGALYFHTPWGWRCMPTQPELLTDWADLATRDPRLYDAFNE